MNELNIREYFVVLINNTEFLTTKTMIILHSQIFPFINPERPVNNTSHKFNNTEYS